MEDRWVYGMTARKQYLLRIDPDVWEGVEHWAADDLRSVNSQVEFILRDALKRRGREVPSRTPSSPPPDAGEPGC